MNFKKNNPGRIFPGNFYIWLAIRLILLSINAVLLSLTVLSIENEYLFLTINLSAIFIVQIILLFRYITRIDRELSDVLSAVRYGEFTDSVFIGDSPTDFSTTYNLITILKKTIREKSMELHSRDLMFKEIVDSSPCPILVYNKDMSVINCNKNAVRLLGMDNIYHLTVLDKVSPGMSSHIVNMKSGTTYRINLKGGESSLRRDTLSLVISKEEWISNGVPLYIISFQDVRNLEISKEIESWQKIIKVIRHEIMNSLSPVPAISNSIRDQLRGPDGKVIDPSELDSSVLTRVVNGIETIEKASTSLLGFIDKYRQLTSLPSPSKILTDLPQLVRDAVNQYLAGKDGRNITLSIPEGDIMVNIDQSLVKMALTNIIKNAFEAIPHGEEPGVSISIASNNINSEIHISDNGTGISDNIAENIFIPFFSTKERGSGIGLSVARQIIIMHCGSLDFITIEGRGTTFIIKIPAANNKSINPYGGTQQG